MMLTALSWAGAVLASLFCTLCLACGLYYMAEFVEEYTVLSRKIIQRSIWAVTAVHVLLMAFESELPWWQLGLSVGCNLFYTILLQNFPFIQLTDPSFIMSCVLVLGNHFVWFNYFSNHYWFRFQEVASFFIICVWAVPFMLFVSLSAGDNTLPSVDPNSPMAEKMKKDKIGSILKSVLTVVLQKKDELLPTKSSGVKAF